jgi:hypothetical protein
VRCRPNLPAIPKLLTTSNAAVDGADHCHCLGAFSPDCGTYMRQGARLRAITRPESFPAAKVP